MIKYLLSILILSICYYATSLADTLPYYPYYIAEMEKSALNVLDEKDERVSSFEKDIQSKLDQALSIFTHNYEINEGLTRSEALEEAEEDEEILTLRTILSELDRLKKVKDVKEQYRIASSILTLEYSLKREGYKPQSIELLNHLGNLLKGLTSRVFKGQIAGTILPGSTDAKKSSLEALNLADPWIGKILSTAELANYISSGEDISKFEPLQPSPFWAPKNLSGLNIAEDYLAGHNPLYEGVDLDFPKEDQPLYFDKLVFTQSKPKISVNFFTKKGKKRKARIKVGAETHSEPMNNALMSALGYNADVNIHRKQIKIYLGKNSYDDIKNGWRSYFYRQNMHYRWDLEDLMSEHGVDPELGEYIVFYEGTIEAKPKDVFRVGPYRHDQGIAKGLREARALLMFHVWIGNQDQKVQENSKVAFRLDKNGIPKVFMYDHDVGHALGFVLNEQAQAFPWDITSSQPGSKTIKLDYFNLWPYFLPKFVTHADAKWLVRKIGKLTKEQISQAANLGQWPHPAITKLYIEKLSNRRNQLVRAFGLEKEVGLLHVDRNLSYGNVIKNGELIQSRFEGSTQEYAKFASSLIYPVLKKIYLKILSTAQSGLAGPLMFSIYPFDVSGFEMPLAIRVTVGIGRRIEAIDNPTRPDEQFLVADSMTLGLRFDYGFFARGLVGRQEVYTVIYPVGTKTAGILNQSKKRMHKALPFLLRHEVNKGLLPERYVLVKETKAETGTFFSSRDASVLFPALRFFGIEGSPYKQTTLSRLFVDSKNPESPALYEDRVKYDNADFELFIRPLFSISLAGGEKNRNGHISGTGIKLKSDFPAPLLNQIIEEGHLDALSTASPQTYSVTPITSDFDRTFRWYSLFGFLSGEYENRTDDITRNNGTSPEDKHFRTTQKIHRQWRGLFDEVFDDVEENYSIRIMGALDQGQRSIISLYEFTDSNTYEDELQLNYDFVRHLLPNDRGPFMPEFTAKDWTSNKRFDQTILQARVEYGNEAIDNILAYARKPGFEKDFLMRASQNAGVKYDDVMSFLSTSSNNGAQPNVNLSTRSLAFNGQRVITQLKQAVKYSGDAKKQFKAVVAAIYKAHFRHNRQSYNSSLIQVIHDIAQGKNLYVEGKLFRPLGVDNRFPGRNELIGHSQNGHKVEQNLLGFQFSPFNAVETWSALDWVK